MFSRSRRVQLTGDEITKRTFGTVLSLSEQEIAWTLPEMLGVAIQDMAREIRDRHGPRAHDRDRDASRSGVGRGAFVDRRQRCVPEGGCRRRPGPSVYAASKHVPDTLFVDPLRYAYLLSLVDGNKRPLLGLDSGGPTVNSPGSISGSNLT